MPSRGTPQTAFRLRPEIKGPAVARAAAEGRTLSEVVTDLLREYGAGRVGAPDPAPTQADTESSS